MKCCGVRSLLLLGMVMAMLAGCQDSGTTGTTATGDGREAATLALPHVAARAEAQVGPVPVAATTSVIGDVVAQVGGEAITLTTLMAPGQDPHSYEPSTTDLTRVAQAEVIFINGWDLEEGLVSDLANIAGDTPLVPVSAGITPLYLGENVDHEEDEDGEEEHEHETGAPDPHVWLDPQHVQQWVRNIELVLSTVDPANAGLYEANAAAYLQELEALEEYMEETLAPIAPERRKLVTNHDALAYFARRFDFEIVGTVLPAASTLAEPSAQGMVDLVEKMREAGVCTIFTETTANARLAETVAAELDTCEQVQVLSLHTGALGVAGSGAQTYVQMMRLNTDAVLRGAGSGDQG